MHKVICMKSSWKIIIACCSLTWVIRIGVLLKLGGGGWQSKIFLSVHLHATADDNV